MSSIRTDPVALDSNEYILAFRQETLYPASATLLFQHIDKIQLYVPLQVLREIGLRLTPDEMRRCLHIMREVAGARIDYTPAAPDLVRYYENAGAKKGDAVIAAHLHADGIPWLVSENRHFLSEITDLPFKVLTASSTVKLLR